MGATAEKMAGGKRHELSEREKALLKKVAVLDQEEGG